MLNQWDFQLIQAKYHKEIVDKLIKDFKDYEEKRFLIGILNELALSVSHLINSFLIYAMINNNYILSKKSDLRLKDFKNKIGRNYLSLNLIMDLLKIIEFKKMQKNSPIQFFKKDKLVFLSRGIYITLSFEVLFKLNESLGLSIKNFPKD
ncbi:MAG: hypothetical protein PHX15_00375 [Candidatus Nanoarchaeia archaeon]|jgi:hypothetical protein|nr:hypothetical protein [Candidatus Nanoarchaeia archaeon]MDD3993641.1 hypothetical protein [Candidatus Nanoarchaeia archaeon]MDD4563619.1 hypothetical protein [Candidatus Nanoarchaeia archaeon]